MQANQQQVQEAIENLLLVARRNGVYIAGFAFKSGSDFVTTNFGNCDDCHQLRLFELLCKHTAAKRKLGQVIEKTVDERN